MTIAMTVVAICLALVLGQAIGQPATTSIPASDIGRTAQKKAASSR